MLMYKEEGGFHNFHIDEVEQAKKDGWVDGEPIRAAALAAKTAKAAEPKLSDKRRNVYASAKTFSPEPEEPATIEPHARRGRPRKAEETAVAQVIEAEDI